VRNPLRNRADPKVVDPWFRPVHGALRFDARRAANPAAGSPAVSKPQRDARLVSVAG